MKPLPSERELMRYKGHAIQEIGGKTRDEAIANAKAFLDAHPGSRRRSAEATYDFYRVRNLGYAKNPWWAVFYRFKKRQSA